MVKYYNAMVVFEEIPDEITLAINITNCPCRCEGCHSKFLWEDVGTELTTDELDRLISLNDGITCVCLMGGDADQSYINSLARYIREKHSDLRVGWYSGKDVITEKIDIRWFDYIKVGHYDKEKGGLTSENTNQILYKLEHYAHSFDLKNITYRFWKKKQ